MSVATQTTAIDSLFQRAELLAEKLNNFKNIYLSFASKIDDIMSEINFDTPVVEQAPVAQAVAPVQPVAQPAIKDINDINIDDIMANLDLSDATMTH